MEATTTTIQCSLFTDTRKINSTLVHSKSGTIHQSNTRLVSFKYKTIHIGYKCCGGKWKQKEERRWAGKGPIVFKTKGNGEVELSEEEVGEKKGSIVGAVALIVGTSIGSGILALPKKASLAGILPSSISMIVCWGFLLIEALLLVEINVSLMNKKVKAENEDTSELAVISIRTMARETLGGWGETLATISYVFLGYTSMIAYSSKSGEIIFHVVNFPEPVSGCLFTLLFALLIALGGTRVTDQVNQWLTSTMIGLLLAIEVLAILCGGWPGFERSVGNWGKVPSLLPVLIFSLVYHDLMPVLCAYMGGDIRRLRTSIIIGGLIPLLALLVWNGIALGLNSQDNQVIDPVDLLMSVRWGGFSYMVEAFSLLAVGTSLIGTLLGFSAFFKEQLQNLFLQSYSTTPSQILQESKKPLHLMDWWGRNKINYIAMAIVVAPTLLISTTVPDAFSAATDIAGGYCMTILYGILPPAMALASREKDQYQTNQNKRDLVSSTRPALLGVAIFACGIVIEQIVQDFSAFHP